MSLLFFFAILATSFFLSQRSFVLGLCITLSWLMRTCGWKAKSGRLFSSPAVLALERTTYKMPGLRDSNAFVPGLITINLLMFPSHIVMPWTLCIVVVTRADLQMYKVRNNPPAASAEDEWAWMPLETQEIIAMGKCSLASSNFVLLCSHSSSWVGNTKRAFSCN